MSVRLCPHCKTEIPAPEAAARSNDIECPKCGTRLEVAPGSRTISTLAGLAAGAIAWRLSIGSTSDLGVAPLVRMSTANLRNAPAVPAPAPPHTARPAGHDAGGHDGGHQ